MDRIVNFKGFDVAGPIYFPSISSVKTALPPIEYVRFLTALSDVSKSFLVSAYDLEEMAEEDREHVYELLKLATTQGSLVIMDSGNYESFWKSDQVRWKEDVYHEVLSEVEVPLAFGFDNQEPKGSLEDDVKDTVEQYQRDTSQANGTQIVPIVHGEREDLPQKIAMVAELSGAPMVAVPERRLGNSVFERMESIAKARKELNQTGRYVGLHLLGTGNPISLALFTLSGADSFDGLEWCQTVVDHESALLHHLSQADFFSEQSDWWDVDLPFQGKVLAHNLQFYSRWLDGLSRAVQNSTEQDFCRLSFPKNIYQRCSKSLGWG